VVDIPAGYGKGRSQANVGMKMREQAKQDATSYLISVVDQLQARIAAKLNLSLSSSVVSDVDVAGAIIKAGEDVEEGGWV
jgi:Flp pilus assembly protein TadD